MNKKKNYTLFWILFIIFMIIAYIGSFGKIDINIEKEKREKEHSSNDKLTKLKSRYQRITKLIQKKESLYLKLSKKFKRIYFGVRVVLTGFYMTYNFLLYYFFDIKKLGDILNWNQLAVMIIVLFSFTTFGTFSNAQDYIKRLKMRLEISIYGKYINLDKQLEEHNQEKLLLTASIKSTQLELSVPMTNKDI